MNENTSLMGSSRKPAAWKKLVDQLSSLDSGEDSILPMEMDMLSLIVSGTLNGENIAQRYPAFYQKLVENAGLRQAFLDALESIEAESSGELVPLPGASHSRLDFLTHHPSSPVIERAEEDHWRATWERTIEQLKTIFLPHELVYRASGAEVEDPWFTLLRDELTTGGITYDVLLDCTLSSAREGALSMYLNLAVTLSNPEEAAKFPLRASLYWGTTYQESLLIMEEGRFHFPDIPIAYVFDEQESQIRAGFRLALEAVP